MQAIDSLTKKYLVSKCTQQLTDWVPYENQVQFAIDQLGDSRKWLLKKTPKGFAVFIDPSECNFMSGNEYRQKILCESANPKE